MTLKQLLILIDPAQELDIELLTQHFNTNEQHHKCGKALERGDLVIRCQSCCNVPNFVQCIDCAKLGDHANHYYSVQSQFFGQCGCGNKSMFTRESSCLHHDGAQEPILDQLSSEQFNALIFQMGLALTKILAGKDDGATDVINSSAVLTRIAAVVGLCSSDDVQLADLYRNRSDLVALRPVVTAECLVAQIVASALSAESAPAAKLLVDVLPKDEYYVHNVLRALGPVLPLFAERRQLRLTLLQPMACPMAVHVAGAAFLDQFSEVVKNSFARAQLGFEEFQPMFQALMSHQVLRTGTALRTILFETEKFLPNLVAMQRLLECFAVDPNEKFENSKSIKKPIANHGRFHESLFREVRLDDAITISKDATVEELEQFQIKRQYLGQKQTDYSHLIRQMTNMVHAFKGEQESPARSGFTLHASSLLQKLMCDVSHQFNVDLVPLTTELAKSCGKDISTLVTELITPLIVQNLWYLYVENGLEYKQNFNDFAAIQNQIDKLISQKIDQLQCYYVVSEFLRSFPELLSSLIVSIYDTQFNDCSVVIVDYLSILNFMPKPEFTQEFLKHIAITFDPTTYDFTQALDYKTYFSQNDIITMLNECYKIIPNQDSFHSSKSEFVGQQYFEPCLYLALLEGHIQQLSAFSNFLPELIKNPKVNRGLLKHFDTEFLQKVASDVINDFEESKLGLGQAMLAARIVRTALIKLDNSGYKSEQLNLLLVNQTETNQCQAVKLDVQRKMTMLKVKNQQNEKQSQLMVPILSSAKSRYDEICQYCHEPIEIPFYVPAYVTICAQGNFQIPYFCYHKYHDTCSKKLSECAVCGFTFERRYQLGALNQQSDWIDEVAKMIVYIFQMIEMNQSTRHRLFKEITKLKFMVQYTNNKEQFEASNTDDASKLKQIVYNNLDLDEDSIIDLIMRTIQFDKKPCIIKEGLFLNNSIEIAHKFNVIMCGKCGKDCGLHANNPLQCLSCGNSYHLSCADDDEEFCCPNCSFRFAFCPKAMAIVRHRGHIIFAPYKSIFGQFQQKLIGDRQDLCKKMVSDLELSLLCGDRQKVDRETMKLIGFKVPPSREALLLLELIDQFRRDNVPREIAIAFIERAPEQIREEVTQLIEDRARERERRQAIGMLLHLIGYEAPSQAAQQILRAFRDALHEAGVPYKELSEKALQRLADVGLHDIDAEVRQEVVAFVGRLGEFELINGVFCVKKAESEPNSNAQQAEEKGSERSSGHQSHNDDSETQSNQDESSEKSTESHRGDEGGNEANTDNKEQIQQEKTQQNNEDVHQEGSQIEEKKVDLAQMQIPQCDQIQEIPKEQTEIAEVDAEQRSQLNIKQDIQQVKITNTKSIKCSLKQIVTVSLIMAVVATGLMIWK